MNWIHTIIDVPSDLAQPTREFWSEVIGAQVGEPWPNHPEFTSLEPAVGDAFVHVQVVDGPARIHLDLSVDDLDAETRRLVAAGAVASSRRETWQVLTSPGGMPFCLVKESDHTITPDAVRWPGGHASRLLQVCIDSPEAVHNQEVVFWPTATRWSVRPSERPEFAGKCYPPNGPIRLLLQRLGADDPGVRTRAHLDLATDDVVAEVARVRELGATMIGPGFGWVALRDPAGLPFCVTDQSPS
ncbi:MAG: VOC family protein [Propionibacteriales bacterium]|nr:VOC family protein [Propionibacteriales bacterium]